MCNKSKIIIKKTEKKEKHLILATIGIFDEKKLVLCVNDGEKKFSIKFDEIETKRIKTILEAKGKDAS